MNRDQLSRFLARLPASPSTDDGSLRVVFPSALSSQLTREHEDAMTEHCLDQIKFLEDDLGRTTTGSPDWFTSCAKTEDNRESSAQRKFFEQRALYDLVANGECGWREHLYGELWAESNEHIPLTQRYLRQMIARANGYFFGVSPWYDVAPHGPDDRDLAKQVNRWSRWKDKKSKTREVLEQAVARAFTVGEGIVKTAWDQRVNYFHAWSNVVIDTEGDPLVAKDRDYVFGDDAWVRNDQEVFVLKRDMNTTLPAYAEDPAELVIDNRIIARERDRFQGADISVLETRNFLIDRLEPSVAEAKFCCHLFDRPAIQIAHTYLEGIAESGSEEDLPKILDLLRMADAAGSGNPATIRERGSLGETSFEFGNEPQGERHSREPVVELAECYLHYDPNGSGVLKDIMVLIDRKNQVPVAYDYIDNVTPRGQRPFHVLRVNPVEDRWHGEAVTKALWDLNHSYDLQYNRANYGNTSSGTVVVWDPTKFEESDHMPDGTRLNLNSGEPLTLKPGVSIEDAIQTVEIYQPNQDSCFKFMETIGQMVSNISGVAQANDMGMNHMQSSKLATGQLMLDRHGQELFAPFLSHLTPGIESVLLGKILLEISKIDDKEAYRFLDGEDIAMAELKKADVSGFQFDLDLQLHKYKAEATAVQNAEIIAMLNQYDMMRPALQQACRSVILGQMDLYGHSDGERRLKVLDDNPNIQMFPAPVPAPTPAAPQALNRSPERRVAPMMDR